MSDRTMPVRTLHAFVVCRVDTFLFAVDLRLVDHVLWMLELIPVPSAPDGIAGLMNYRGRYIPVVDVRRRMGWNSRRFRLEDRLIVTGAGTGGIALAVDSVEDVIEVAEETIQQVEWLSDAAPYLATVLTRNGRAVLIQDVEAWLSDSEQSHLDDLVRRLQPAAAGLDIGAGEWPEVRE